MVVVVVDLDGTEGDLGAGMVGLFVLLFPVKAFLFPLLVLVEVGVTAALVED